ncbi:MAG: hypothetical protein QXT63_02140 [Thermoplasmata archaeon]
MRCAEHRDRNAIGMCSICGKGVCEECNIGLENQSKKFVCRNCAKSENLGRSSQFYSPYPYYMPMHDPNYFYFSSYNPYQYIYRTDIPTPALPIGLPSKTPFRLGIIGGIFLVIASILFGMQIEANMTYRYQHFYDYPFWLVYCSIFVSIGCLLHGLGYFGYFRNYGNNWGLYASAFSMITAVVLPLSFVASISYVQYSSYNPYLQADDMPGYSITPLIIFGELFMGILFLLFGWTLIRSRAFTNARKIHFTAGLFQIIAAGYIFLVILVREICYGYSRSIGEDLWFVVSFATIFAILALYMAKLPTNEEIALAELITENSLHDVKSKMA